MVCIQCDGIVWYGLYPVSRNGAETLFKYDLYELFPCIKTLGINFPSVQYILSQWARRLSTEAVVYSRRTTIVRTAQKYYIKYILFHIVIFFYKLIIT